MFNLLIEAGFFPFNVHALFRFDLYGKAVRGMTAHMYATTCVSYKPELALIY